MYVHSSEESHLGVHTESISGIRMLAVLLGETPRLPTLRVVVPSSKRLARDENNPYVFQLRRQHLLFAPYHSFHTHPES